MYIFRIAMCVDLCLSHRFLATAGGVSSSRLANTRSALSNKLSNKTTRDGVLEPLDDDNSLQSQALESFMQGKISELCF